MAQIRSSRWWGGLTSILAATFLASVAALTFAGWPTPASTELTGPEVEPSASSDPETAEIIHPARLDANPLTGNDIASIAPDWLLVEYNTSAGAFAPASVTVTPEPNEDDPSPAPITVAGDGAPVWEIPGPTILYVVDPSGSLYEAADLGVDPAIDLLAWLPDHRTVIVGRPANGGGVTLHRLDILTGEESGAFPGPTGEGSTSWLAPRVKVTRDGAALMVTHGGDASSVTVIGLAGAPLARPVVDASLGTVIQAPDGTIVVVEAAPAGAETETTVVSYTPPGLAPKPSPTEALPPGVVLPPVPSLSPSPSPSPSVSASGPAEYTRAVHGLPAGEDQCQPFAWPLDRQLLLSCPRADGTVVVYTLALLTSTFVDVSVIDLGDDDPFLAINPAGTRIAGGRSVVSAIGTPVWEIGASQPNPIGLVWAESLLIEWGDADVALTPGAGFPRVTARRVADGEDAYVIDAHRGAAGFGTILTSP